MTDKQSRRFYFPAWRQALATFARMEHKCLVCLRPEDEMVSRLWQIAEGIAETDLRTIQTEDLRHACHVVALGRDKSSKVLSNKEVDRVVALFKLLQDPCNIDAVMTWDNPETPDRKRLLYSIEHIALDPAYKRQVLLDKFDTRAVGTLNNVQLTQYMMTLKARASKQNAPEVDPDNEPF